MAYYECECGNTLKLFLGYKDPNIHNELHYVICRDCERIYTTKLENDEVILIVNDDGEIKELTKEMRYQDWIGKQPEPNKAIIKFLKISIEKPELKTDILTGLKNIFSKKKPRVIK